MEKAAEKIVCAECGQERPVSSYQMTRWGHLTKVCNKCVTAKRKKNREKTKTDEMEVLKKQLEDAKKMRLASFTPRELMMELRERGYDGELDVTIHKKVRLSEL